MQLPFTAGQFRDLFRQYNDAIGAVPFALTVLGVAVMAVAAGRAPWRHRAVALFLAVTWIWAGAVYQWGYFTRINPAAWVFGGLFVAQGLYLAAAGLGFIRLEFRAERDAATILGGATMAYALLLYPLLGMALGHGYPAGPSFGAPCPTVIFFFGMTMWHVRPAPWPLLLIPTLWAIVGTSAALHLGFREDLGLPLAALLGLAVAMALRHPRATPPRHAMNH